MKKYIAIWTSVFTMFFPSISFAEWTWVTMSGTGTMFYVDFDRIRKNSGYVYFWILLNYEKPSETGVLSIKTYKKADCGSFRYKILDGSFHSEPMGRGTGETMNVPDEWDYPPPNSTFETVMEKVCKN